MEYVETFEEWHLNVGSLLAPAKVSREEGEKPLKEAGIPSQSDSSGFEQGRTCLGILGIRVPAFRCLCL